MTVSVAIVGRPNVGKSTLFNRLAGRRLALVHDQPGVTRDRRETPTRFAGLDLVLIDTAGLEDANPDSLTGRMRAQTEAAARAADVCLFVIDGRAGVTPADRAFAAQLRRDARAVVLLVNKCEGARMGIAALEAYELGLGDPIAISAEHGEGLGELAAALSPFAAAAAESDAAADRRSLDDSSADGDSSADDGDPSNDGPADDSSANDGPADDGPADDGSVDDGPVDDGAPVRLAVIGRPNVGKSTLINAILGEDRLLTGPEAGVTRDSISVEWVWSGRRVRLFDTAGMRRKARVHEALERLSVGDALRALRFAEVALLCVDATQAFDKQDMQLADLVQREGRALVVVVTKWDLVEDPRAALADLRETLARRLPSAAGAPLATVSALTGRGLDRALEAALRARAAWNARVSTARLNRWLADATARHPPPAVAGRAIPIRYITQARTRPPTFVLFSSRADQVPTDYQRYLVNALRETFSLQETPVRLHLRKPDNPYARSAARRG